MTRSTGWAGLVEQASEGRRINSASYSPCVIEQLRDHVQWNLLPGKLAVRFPGQQHLRELALWFRFAREFDPRSFTVALQKRWLSRFGQIAPEKARRRIQVFNIFRG